MTMRRCNKCKKPRRWFNFAHRVCDACYKRRKNRYWENKTGIKLPSKGTERRQKIKQNGGYITHQQWLNLKKKYDYRCVCCGRQEPTIKLQADHVVPVVRGGPSWPWNMQPLCSRCNQQKGSKIIDYRKRFERMRVVAEQEDRVL